MTESPEETLPAWMSGRSPLAARSANAAQRKSGGKGPSVWGVQAAARGPQSKKAPGTYGQECAPHTGGLGSLSTGGGKEERCGLPPVGLRSHELQARGFI